MRSTTSVRRTLLHPSVTYPHYSYNALHYGVCSNYLESLPVGSEIACFVRSAPNFRLPDSPHVPVIMVGPGTGIAPFRSFWQKRNLDMKAAAMDGDVKKPFGNMTLLIGCRHQTVELYRDETQVMKQLGVLTHVYSAYSRIPGKPKVNAVQYFPIYIDC
ncbi:nitric oxide synthase, inducible [Trichonephila clavipes]|nr:nitric oxide synthase, inducible [Trichonephila clavipes]